MKIKSLGLKSDLMLLKKASIIQDRRSYISVVTPNHLSFYWGNFLIYPQGPTQGDYKKWVADFKSTFKNHKVDHIAFAWDIGDGNSIDYSEFIKNGFKYDETVVLVAKKLTINYPNNEIEIKKAVSEEDWKKIAEFQITAESEAYEKKNEYFKSFFEKRFKQYKKLVNAKMGHWYFATIQDEIVADLGLFWENGLARYQPVKTHKNYRRIGIAQTLMKFAAEDSSCNVFVVETEDDNPGINMYKSIGFEIHEIRASLCKGEYADF